MYADFNYYQTEYGGKVIESADNFTHFGRKAERRIDVITGNKLQFAFPTKKKDKEAVKDCFCELVDFLYQLDIFQRTVADSAGVVEQADGTIRGKVVTSISSGSESIGYSANGSADTSLMEAAKDKKVADAMINSMVRDGLSGVPDVNGVNLLYAGIPYPGRRE